MNRKTYIAGLFLLALGCDSLRYDAPPEAKLAVPEGGVYNVGEALILTFSEPVVEESLAVRVWFASRDIEAELELEGEPLLARCTPNDEDCPDASVTLSEDGMRAEVLLSEEGLGQPDVPMTLEVLPGLRDEEGRATGVSGFFDFQFIPSFDGTGEGVAFNDGFYVIGAVIDDPIEGVNLKLIGEVISTDAGRVAIAMGAADPIGDAPKNTMDPLSLKIDSSDQGYGVHAMGNLVEVANGDRFIETEPFDVSIFLDKLGIGLKGLVLSAKVIDQEGGLSVLDGTLAYTTLELTNDGVPFFNFEAGTVTFEGREIAEGQVPEGAPTVCEEPCGGLAAQCAPPAEFPEEGTCFEEE